MEPDVDHSADPLLNVTLPLRWTSDAPARRDAILTSAHADPTLGMVRPCPVRLLRSTSGQCGPTASSSRSSRAATRPLALCLHGFPDSAHTWRHLLADAGRGRLPGRRSVPAGLRADGGTRRRPLPDRARSARDAIALHEALGGDERRRAHRPRLGRADGLRRGRARARALAGASSSMAVPPGGALAAAFLTNLRQLKRSWYMFFFQHPLADLWSAPTTSRSSTCCGPTGRRASTPPPSWSSLKPSLRDPANLQRRARLLPRPSRRRPDGPGPRRRPGGRPQQVPPQPPLYLHGADDGCIGVEVARGGSRASSPATSPSRSSTEPATSCTSSGPTRSTGGSWSSSPHDRAESGRRSARRTGGRREAGLRDVRRPSCRCWRNWRPDPTR